MPEARHEVVVITGASAGIGRAAVQQFARRGARIALIARDTERLETARAEAERLGAPEDFRRVTDVTYHGFVWGTMAALKRMRARDRGTIVQVSSALAYRSIPLQSPYCGAKHAIKGFTQSVRTELEHERSNIHIAVVDMPGVNTPQFEWCKTTLTHHPKPIGTVFQPEVAARAIWWAAHARRAEICVGAPTLSTRAGREIRAAPARPVPGAQGCVRPAGSAAHPGRSPRQPVAPRARTVRGARHVRRRREHAQPAAVGDDAPHVAAGRRGRGSGSDRSRARSAPAAQTLNNHQHHEDTT